MTDDIYQYDTIRNPGDEHIQVVVSKNIRLCQKTMEPRIDGLETRLNKLDEEDTGKVTLMWHDYSTITGLVRKAFIVGLVLAVATVLGNLWMMNKVSEVVAKVSHSVSDKNIP